MSISAGANECAGINEELPFPSPSKEIINCDYYLKRELAQSCGPKSYYIGFGYQYCHTFMFQKRRYYDFTSKGQLWLTQVGLCLQKTLHQNSCKRASKGLSLLSCKAVENFAMGSHLGCYLRPDKSRPQVSICNISYSDTLLLAGIIKSTFVNPKVLEQMIGVMKGCGNIPLNYKLDKI